MNNQEIRRELLEIAGELAGSLGTGRHGHMSRLSVVMRFITDKEILDLLKGAYNDLDALHITFARLDIGAAVIMLDAEYQRTEFGDRFRTLSKTVEGLIEIKGDVEENPQKGAARLEDFIGHMPEGAAKESIRKIPSFLQDPVTRERGVNYLNQLFRDFERQRAEMVWEYLAQAQINEPDRIAAER